MRADFTVYYEDGTQWNGTGDYTQEELTAMQEASFRDACQMVVEEKWTEEQLDTIKAIEMNIEGGGNFVI